MLSNFWHVRLGEGGRLMTSSQIGVAVARCWIDEETQVRKPKSSDWTKLGDAVPAREKLRITEEPKDVVAPEPEIETSVIMILSGEYEIVSDSKKQKETSAMMILSGEYEVVDAGDEDEKPLSKAELSSARPSRLAPRLIALALVALVGGTLVARRYVPKLDAQLHAMTAAMTSLRSDLAPAQAAQPADAVAKSPEAPPALASAPITVTSSATTYLVPKMRAPSPPPPVSPVAMTTTTKTTAKTVPAKGPPHIRRGTVDARRTPSRVTPK